MTVCVCVVPSSYVPVMSLVRVIPNSFLFFFHLYMLRRICPFIHMLPTKWFVFIRLYPYAYRKIGSSSKIYTNIWDSKGIENNVIQENEKRRIPFCICHLKNVIKWRSVRYIYFHYSIYEWSILMMDSCATILHLRYIFFSLVFFVVVLGCRLFCCCSFYVHLERFLVFFSLLFFSLIQMQILH